MKFSNGFWLKREGVTIDHPKEVRDFVIADEKVTLYIAPQKVMNRGMTLGGTLLTMSFTSPLPDIIALEVTHHKGGLKNQARFKVQDENCSLTTVRTETGLIIQSGDTTAEICFDEFSIVYRHCGKFLTSTGFKKMGYAKTNDGAFMLEQLDLSVGEKIYGLGERFTPFVKNGQIVDVWNEDGGTSSEQSYKNIPFHLSSRGYGIFVDHTEKVSYEIASEAVSRIQFSVAGETLRYCVVGASSRKGALNTYTKLTGRPALPPLWSFGLWLSTSFTTSYDEKTVTSFIDGMASRDIPLHVFHYDCFWMKEYEWCNFKWDEEMFPDVNGMLARLKAKGLKICVWINPYIGQKSYLFDEGAEKGYLLKRPDGSVWQWDLWQPGMGLVDFTNPGACAWFQSKLKVLLDQGVDCFKTDFGERIPTDVEYFDGTDPVSMHNYYTQLYNKTVFDLLKKERGEGDAVLFARSATAGGQQFPVHWGGDCDATYLSMAESLRGGLSLTLSGFGFWSHDISGFESTATPDVYKRWVAFGLLSTHSRLHGSTSYRVPWLFDDEAVDVLRFFTNLKCRLAPYLFTTAVETNRTGVPAMRAMLLEFEDDNSCLDLDTQYMIGENVMAAPIFHEDGSVDYYLPNGTWTHLLSGETVQGGSWKHDTYDYFSLPLFVRENTLLPMGQNTRDIEYDFANETELRLYALKDGAAAYGRVCDKNADEVICAKASRDKDSYNITFGKGTAEILLVGIHEISELTGADFQKEEMGIRIIPADSNISFIVD